jgi:hypothetical protein
MENDFYTYLICYAHALILVFIFMLLFLVADIQQKNIKMHVKSILYILKSL